jgi:hypothetical protein
VLFLVTALPRLADRRGAAEPLPLQTGGNGSAHAPAHRPKHARGKAPEK